LRSRPIPLRTCDTRAGMFIHLVRTCQPVGAACGAC
jgi:hypothetical protein